LVPLGVGPPSPLALPDIKSYTTFRSRRNKNKSRKEKKNKKRKGELRIISGAIKLLLYVWNFLVATCPM
jgi:hypothetical protein